MATGARQFVVHDPLEMILCSFFNSLLLTQTQVIKGKFSRVLSWYDNEWGFSNRMCDTTIQIAGLI